MIMLAATTNVVNYCQLYGGPASPYISGWLPVTYIVIALGFLIVAVLYMVSRFMPPSFSSKIREITKVEITQVVLGILILLILLSATTAACNLSSSLGSTVLASAGAAGRGLSPFEYADYYIGTLALNHGINLLGTIYTTSIGYAIEARVMTVISQDLSAESPPIGSIISVEVTYGHDLGTIYGALADVYFDLLSPILIITIGMLYLQYLALPILQSVAFTIILPLALLIRFIPYGGNGLKTTSNAILAIAVAAYIIYPLMIAFDSYMVYWIYSPTLNPAYGCTNCLSTAYVLTDIPSSSFLSTSVTSSQNSALGSITGALGISTPATNNILSTTIYSSISGTDPVPTATYITEAMSQFVFVAVFLFGLNLAVTIGFAMGLARGLDAGVEGSASFWGSL